MSFEKIRGEALCGFAGLFEEPRDLMGVTTKKPPPPPPQKGGAARGSVPVQPPKGTSKQKLEAGPHMRALANAASAAKKATDTSNKAQKSVKSFKPTAHLPLVPVKPVAVHGGYVVLGAIAPKTLTPRQATAIAKHTKTIANHAKAVKRLEAAASQASKAGSNTTSFVKTTTPLVKAALTPPWKGGKGAKIHGIYGAYIGADANGLTPGQPGYDPTSDPASPQYIDPYAPDPTLADPNAGGVDSSGVVTAPDGSVLYDPSRDPAVVKVPTRGGQLSAADAQIPWQHVPDDGIRYDGSYGLPANSIGSWNVFYGGSGRSEGGGFGIPGFLRGQNAKGDIKWMFNGPELGDNRFHDAPDNFQSSASSGAPDATAVSNNSMQRGWGPVVGNPSDPYLAGLQYAIADQAYFWQAQNAPTWATTEADAKIAATNQKTVDASTAAAVVQAAQMAKDLADQAEKQAKAEAEMALKQQQAEATATAADTVAQQQLAVQQQQADLEAQHLEQQDAAKQAEFERQMQMQQAQQDAAQASYERTQPQYAQQPYAQGNGGSGGGDASDFNPEGAADMEADEIDYGTDDEAVVGADGKSVRFDQWGNAQ